eukprot:GHUV01023191.1.p1 GENE.GHUV01023191.1~~GHUV01023191.1.p1  ORF type:complete len:111 (-),score=19.80 GHUV01023191.1:916-1248(-)
MLSPQYCCEVQLVMHHGFDNLAEVGELCYAGKLRSCRSSCRAECHCPAAPSELTFVTGSCSGKPSKPTSCMLFKGPSPLIMLSQALPGLLAALVLIFCCSCRKCAAPVSG